MVVEEGGEAHTVIFVSAVLQRADGAERHSEVEFVVIESSHGKEGASWEHVEKIMGNEQFLKWIVGRPFPITPKKLSCTSVSACH